MTVSFDVEAFQNLLSGTPPRLGSPVTWCAATASTNDDAFRAAAAGAPDGALFVSDTQTAGRGRRGNTWHSEPGEGLLFSLLLVRELGHAQAELLPLVAGLAVRAAVARALEASRVTQAVRVKWPNDVLVGTKKLAGILVEGRARGTGPARWVVGVGLNLGRLSLPASVSSRATSLTGLGARAISREALLHQILLELGTRLDAWNDGRGGQIVSELQRFDALVGCPISVGGVRGVGEGIGDDGCLLIRDGHGELHRVRSGHVEHG